MNKQAKRKFTRCNCRCKCKNQVARPRAKAGNTLCRSCSYDRSSVGPHGSGKRWDVRV